MAGVKKVTTIESREIHSHHPQLDTMLPETFRQKYLNNTLEKFDGMISFSSLEHSGLGRYGDGLNPYGDLITMAKVW